MTEPITAAPITACPTRRRRRVLALAVATAVLAPVGFVAPTPVHAEDPSGSVLGLALGTQGPAVADVQQALLDAGVPVVGGVDGYYGQMTVAAVRKYQSDRGLEVTGTIDRATAAALGLVAADVPQSSTGVRAPTEVTVAELVGLAPGVVGPRVAELQRALMAAGIPNVGGTDGVFGPLTKAAVVAYQAAQDLSPTGTIDEATAATLLGGGTVDVATASATASPQSPLVGLQVGASGPAVVDMQTALLDAGLSFAGGADGVFGLVTQNALRQFQLRKGLEATGTVDATTAAALAAPGSLPAASAASTTGGGATATRSLAGLAPGNVGNNVVALQRALIDAGIDLPGGADGIYGPATANAVKAFQNDHGLQASGRVDQSTADALLSGAAPVAGDGTSSGSGFPTFGERGDRVRALQQALIDADIDLPGGADGIFGAQTAGAVMSFQKREDLPVSGVVDAATAELLGLGADAAPAPPSADGITLDAFPMQGTCHFIDTWHAPRGGGRKHEGVDILGPEGRYLYAVVDGTISHVYRDRPGSLTGNGLRLETSDGTYFFYAHLEAVADGIEAGTKVAAGEIIGYNGSTGNAGTPHLHFEVHPQGGAAVNPYPLVAAIDGCDATEPPPQP